MRLSVDGYTVCSRSLARQSDLMLSAGQEVTLLQKTGLCFHLGREKSCTIWSALCRKMPANSRAFFKMNLFFVSLIFAGMGVLHIPPLPQFFLPRHPRNELRCQGPPSVWGGGGAKDRDQREVWRERWRAASPWGERDRRAMTRAVMRPLSFSLMFNHEPVGADPRLRHFAFH